MLYFFIMDLQLILTQNALPYAPIILFGLLMWGISSATVKASGVKTFDLAMGVIALCFAGHITLQILTGGMWGWAIVQFCLGVILFALLVMFVGDKASGLSILSMVGVVMLTPIPGGIVGLIAFIVLTVAVSAIKLRSVKKIVNTLGDTALSVQSGAGLDALLEDKSKIQSATKMKLEPLIIISYLLVAIYYTVRVMMGDH